MINILRIKLNSNRIYGLDILRALAILFVVARHFRHLLPKVIDKYSNYIVFDGVTIFFVLSGFLVGGILIKLLNEKKISSKLILNFWIRRWLRTLPNYFFILIILIILNSIFNNNFHAYKYKNYFFFSQNLFSEHPHFFPEAWSLSVEEWFYLLVPIIIYILIKTFNITVNKSVLITVFGVIICVTIFRYIKYSFLTIDEISNLTTIADRTFRKQVFTRIDSLMYGVFGAYLYFYFNYLWNKYKVHFLIIGLVLFVFMKFNFFGSYGSFFYCVFSFSITSLATLLLLPFLNNLKKGKGCFFKFSHILA